MTTLLNRRLAAALLGSIITLAQTAIAESRVLCGASGAELQKWFDQMVAEQKRPVWIQACTMEKRCCFRPSPKARRSRSHGTYVTTCPG